MSGNWAKICQETVRNVRNLAPFRRVDTLYQKSKSGQGGHSCTDVLIVLICTGIKNVLPNVLIKACFLEMYCLMYWDP